MTVGGGGYVKTMRIRMVMGRFLSFRFVFLFLVPSFSVKQTLPAGRPSEAFVSSSYFATTAPFLVVPSCIGWFNACE